MTEYDTANVYFDCKVSYYKDFQNIRAVQIDFYERFFMKREILSRTIFLINVKKLYENQRWSNILLSAFDK